MTDRTYGRLDLFLWHKEEKSMDSRRIHIEQEGDISIVYIENPPANSLDANTLQELNIHFKDCDGPGAPKAIILTGSGDVFSAGAELRELAQTRTAGEAEAIVGNAKGLFDIIDKVQKAGVGCRKRSVPRRRP